MSLILDALRKSEAERRRGQAPSLYSGLPVLSTRQRPAWLRTLPWVVGGVLVLVALFAFRHDDAPATKAELEQSAAAGADSKRAAPVAPAPAPAPVSAAAPASLPAAPAANVAALRKPKPATGSPTPTASAFAPQLPAPPAPPALPAANEPAPAAEQALPPLAVLDAATRTALPPMKLSMHVYNSDATRRFAIIDGQRVTEGTQLGAAVVTEIRRDGVVLEVGGQRVLLPRP